MYKETGRKKKERFLNSVFSKRQCPPITAWDFSPSRICLLDMHKMYSFSSKAGYTIATSTKSYVQYLPESHNTAASALYLTSHAYEPRQSFTG